MEKSKVNTPETDKQDSVISQEPIIICYDEKLGEQNLRRFEVWQVQCRENYPLLKEVLRFLQNWRKTQANILLKTVNWLETNLSQLWKFLFTNRKTNKKTFLALKCFLLLLLYWCLDEKNHFFFFNPFVLKL